MELSQFGFELDIRLRLMESGRVIESRFQTDLNGDKEVK